jgi:CubicO group peptidase (beta-lactamase class C family)
MSERLRVEHLLRQAIAERVAPAIVLGVFRGGEEATCWGAGSLEACDGAVRLGPPPDPAAARFDLASLTKPLTTLLWCLRLVEAGRLSLGEPIGGRVAVTDAALAATPVWRLLNHTAGLPAHREYFRGLGPFVLRSGDHAGAQRQIRRMLHATPLEAPPGAREVYSDLGFLLLEDVCAAADAPLGTVWPSLPAHGPERLHFRPLPAAGDVSSYAPTERCPWRGRLLRGEVHDDNCWTLGGVAGHAGLFGTAADVLALGRAFLDCWHGRPTALGVGGELMRTATAPRWMHPQGTRVLGWDTPTPGASSAGRHFGRRSIGHLGFTGTSLWLDLEREVGIVLLTNRVCPTRDNVRIRAFRPAIHDAAWAFATRTPPEKATTP